MERVGGGRKEGKGRRKRERKRRGTRVEEEKEKKDKATRGRDENVLQMMFVLAIIVCVKTRPSFETKIWV